MVTALTLSRYVLAEPVMGTVVSFDVRGVHDELAHNAVTGAVQWLHWVDETFSTYRRDSAIRRLDRGELRRSDAPPEVHWVLARCAALAQMTGGYFDVRVTGQLDPSALVKGWAIDRAAGTLRTQLAPAS
jgi:thiamine biosynthesis lipoprotein